MQQYAKKLQSLVGENRAKLVLAILKDFTAAQMPHLEQEVVLLKASLGQAERDFSTGVATRTEVQQSLAKVNTGLLYIIGEIAAFKGDEQQALTHAQQVEAAFQEMEFVPAAAKSSATLWWISGGLVLLVAAFFVWKSAKKPEHKAAPPSIQEQQVEKPKSIAEQKAEQDAWLKKAKDLSAQGQWKNALESINKCFGLGFDGAEIFNERSDIQLHLDHFTEARDDARRAIALDPNQCIGYLSLAQALSKLGDEEGFYSNLETSMRKHCQPWKYTQQPGLLEYRNAPRFKKLIRQYQ